MSIRWVSSSASIRRGPKQIIRCRVDDRLRMASNVNSADLSEHEIEYARADRS